MALQRARSQARFGSVEAFEAWLADAGPTRLDRHAAFDAGNWAALYDVVADAWALGRIGLPRWALDAIAAALGPTGLGRAPARRGAERRGPSRAERGHWAAVREALVRVRATGPAAEAHDDRIAVPRDLLDDLVTGILPVILRTVPSRTGSGRQARWCEAFRQDAVDWWRFRVIWTVKVGRRRDDDLEQPPDVARRARVTVALASRGRVPLGLAHPWQPTDQAGDRTVFEAARVLLARTAAGGSLSALSKSYERVTMAVTRGEWGRFYPSRWVRLSGRGWPREAEADRCR